MSMFWAADTDMPSGTRFVCKTVLFEVQDLHSSIVRFKDALPS